MSRARLAVTLAALAACALALSQAVVGCLAPQAAHEYTATNAPADRVPSNEAAP